MESDPQSPTPGDPRFRHRLDPDEIPEPAEPGAANGEASPTDALKAAMERFEEVRDYASYFLAAKLDGIKAGLRNAGIYAALGVVGALAGAALIVTAVVQLLIGAAGGLAALFGTGAWLGHLVVGGLLLLGVGLGSYLAVSRFMKSSRERMVRKYENIQRRQRAEHGHDVRERAGQAEAGQ